VSEQRKATRYVGLLAPKQRELDATAGLQTLDRLYLGTQQLDRAVELQAKLGLHVGGRSRKLQPDWKRRRLLAAGSQR
jgi:hypothetical protein